MASDILTQLQTCYDQLLTQFFSTVSYLALRHPLVAPEPIPGDPYTQPSKEDAAQDGISYPSNTSSRHRYTFMKPREEDAEMGLQPIPPAAFDRAQQELADDLIRKGQQIEYLIQNLPGLGRDEEEQAREIKQLVIQVREMEALRKQKRRELRQCVQQLDDVVLGMATSINTGNSQSLATRNGTTSGG